MALKTIYVPITKVDETQRMVYGVVASETPDKTGEVLDYDSSKDYFKSWSEEIHTNSGGKSYGNVRAMHGKVAAGILAQPLGFNDSDKVIEAAAKIVDDNEWEKVVSGVYTGFSIGGRYVKTWQDGELKRYTASPVEVSIVDNPCIPGANFKLIKADGAVEDRPFISQEAESVFISNDQVVAKAQELAKAAGVSDGKYADYLDQARKELEAQANPVAKSDTAPAQASVDPEPAQPSGDEGAPATSDPTPATDPAPAVDARSVVKQVWTTPDGKTFDKKADAVAHVEKTVVPMSPTDQLNVALEAAKAALAKASADDKEEGDYGDVEYADPGYQKDKKKRYPVDTEDHIRAAWSYINKKKNAAQYSSDDLDKVKAKIIAAWKDKIDKDGPPSAADKAVRAQTLQKSLYDVSRLVCVIEDLNWLQSSLANEAAWEGDESPIPAQLKGQIASLVGTLKALVDEETSEMFTDAESEEFAELMEGAAKAVSPLSLRKTIDFLEQSTFSKSATFATLQKVGARNSKADLEKIQAVHDHSVALGATCEKDADGDMDKSAAGTLTKADHDTLQKVVAENEELKKAVVSAVEGIGELTKQIEALKNTPIAPTPTNRYHVISKGADDQPHPAQLDPGQAMDFLKTADPGVLAAAAIKLSQAMGGRPITYASPAPKTS
jgi:hypothetical protein